MTIDVDATKKSVNIELEPKNQTATKTNTTTINTKRYTIILGSHLSTKISCQITNTIIALIQT